MILGVPREAQKSPKIKKRPSKNRSKTTMKEKGNNTRRGVSAAAFAQPRESEIPLRKALAKYRKQIESTPALPAECGGLLFAYARTAALQYTPGALQMYRKLIRILAVSVRMLPRPWQLLLEP